MKPSFPNDRRLPRSGEWSFFLIPRHPQTQISDYACASQDLNAKSPSPCANTSLSTRTVQNTTQIWQWVKREIGKPERMSRTCTIMRLTKRARFISLRNWNGIAIQSWTRKKAGSHSCRRDKGNVQSAFDTEKVTKRFYDRISRTEHEEFIQVSQRDSG